MDTHARMPAGGYTTALARPEVSNPTHSLAFPGSTPLVLSKNALSTGVLFFCSTTLTTPLPSPPRLIYSFSIRLSNSGLRLFALFLGYRVWPLA